MAVRYEKVVVVSRAPRVQAVSIVVCCVVRLAIGNEERVGVALEGMWLFVAGARQRELVVLFVVVAGVVLSLAA